MKKFLILLAAILFGISASFAQVAIVNVEWNTQGCPSGTCGGQITDYFIIGVSIWDDANDNWAVQNASTTAVLGATDADVDVSQIDTYCNLPHENTPSFTIYARVALMDTSTNPPVGVQCCNGSDDYSPYDCDDFDQLVEVGVVALN